MVTYFKNLLFKITWIHNIHCLIVYCYSLILVVYIYKWCIVIYYVGIHSHYERIGRLYSFRASLKVTDMLQKNRAGLSFFEVFSTGSTPSAAPEVVHSYRTGRTKLLSPEFITRLLVMTVVPDISAKK